MANDFDLVQRLDIITEICAGKRVLHLGCTNYPYTEGAISNATLLHSELEKVSTDLWGLDADQAGIDVLTANGSKQVIFGDLEKLEEVDLDDAFEVIVAGEVIEHLSNPGLLLNGVQRFMNRNSVLLITTVNAYCAMRFFYYGVRGKRGKIEPVHPDHVAYYSYGTLRLLIERHRLEISNFYFYDLGREHRPHSRPVLNLLNDICVTLSRQWADGIIAVCRLPQ